MDIFTFSPTSNISKWEVVDDVVMGGRSSGQFKINEEGKGLFYGVVSLENNGGFSSVKYSFEQKSISGYTTCKIRLKGDGKSYQFRVKSEPYQGHAYVYSFQTTGEWEEVNIPLNQMYPTFRGRRLDMPNYPVEELSEIRFLIANKKNENFELELDWIKLLR